MLLEPQNLIDLNQAWIDQLREFAQRDQAGIWTLWGMRSALRIALVHAGQVDFVLENDLAVVGKGSLPEWTWIPMPAPLRENQRFPDYLKRTRLVDYWDATAWPEWCQRNENGAISCH